MAEDRRSSIAGSCRVAVLVLLCFVVLTPLLYVPGFMFPYVVPRATVMRAAAAVGAGLLIWIIGTHRSSPVDARDPILWSLLALVAISGLSALAGPGVRHSLFGDFERMWGTVQWAYLTIFYVLLRIFFGDPEWRLYLRVAVYVGAGVATFALFEYLAESAYRTFTGQPTVSTLGNSGYVGGYLLLAAGAAVLAAGHVQKRLCSAAWGLAAPALFGSAVLLAGNRAGLLGAAFGGAAGAALYLADRGVRWKATAAWSGAGLMAVAVVLGAFWLLAPDAFRGFPVLRRLAAIDPSTGSLAGRFGAWTAGIEGFLHRPLLGWGPENFELAYDRFVDPAMHRLQVNQLAPGSLQFDRAHNVLLGTLTETGILGLAAYLGLWASIFIVVFRAWTEDELGAVEAGTLLAAFLGYFVYLQFWFEDHSSAVLLVTLAAFLRYRHTGQRLFRVRSPEGRSLARSVVWGTAALGVVVLALWTSGRTALAARQMARANAAGELGSKVRLYEGARRLAVPEQRSVATEYASAMGELGLESAAALRPSDSLRALYSRGVEGADRALTPVAARNPLAAPVDAARGRLAAGAALVFAGDGVRATARRSLRSAIQKSPALLENRHDLANVEALFGNREAARDELREALAVYDGYGRTYYLMSRMTGEGVDSASLSWLRRSLWLDFYPESRSYLRSTVESLLRRGEPRRAESLLRTYAASRYLPALRAQQADGDSVAAEREAFVRGLTARVQPGGREDRPYGILSRDLPLLALWPRAAAVAGDCRRAALAMSVLINGLSERARTASLLPTLSGQLSRLRNRCTGGSEPDDR